MARSQEDLLDEQFSERETETPDGSVAAEQEEPEVETPPTEEPEKPADPPVDPPAEEEEGEGEEESLESILGGNEESEEKPPVEKPEKPEEEPEEEEAFSFELEDDAFDELAQNKEKFTDFIKGAVEYGREAAKKELREEFDAKLEKAQENILKNIPDVVGRTAQRQQALKTVVSSFYEKNPALSDKKEYVRDMTKVVQSSNPDWSAEEVLGEVAKRAKRDLNISEEAVKREKKRQPTFAGSGGRRSPSGQSDNRSSTEKQLDSFFEHSKKQKS